MFFFKFERRHSVTDMLHEFGLSSIDMRVLCVERFRRSWTACLNSIAPPIQCFIDWLCARLQTIFMIMIYVLFFADVWRVCFKSTPRRSRSSGRPRPRVTPRPVGYCAETRCTAPAACKNAKCGNVTRGPGGFWSTADAIVNLCIVCFDLHSNHWMNDCICSKNSFPPDRI